MKRRVIAPAIRNDWWSERTHSIPCPILPRTVPRWPRWRWSMTHTRITSKTGAPSRERTGWRGRSSWLCLAEGSSFGRWHTGGRAVVRGHRRAHLWAMARMDSSWAIDNLNVFLRLTGALEPQPRGSVYTAQPQLPAGAEILEQAVVVEKIVDYVLGPGGPVPIMRAANRWSHSAAAGPACASAAGPGGGSPRSHGRWGAYPGCRSAAPLGMG